MALVTEMENERAKFRHLETLLAMDMLTNSPSANRDRPERKICTRAKDNNKKCRYSGSCDGTKPRCRFAIY